MLLISVSSNGHAFIFSFRISLVTFVYCEDYDKKQNEFINYIPTLIILLLISKFIIFIGIISSYCLHCSLLHVSIHHNGFN